MYIVRHSFTILNTTATTESSGFTEGVNGTIYAVRSPYAATMPTTNTLTVYAGCTDRVILSGVTLSTDNIIYYPRVAAVDSTVATTSWGTSTQMDLHPVMHCVSTTEKITATVSGTATAASQRDVEIYMQGV